MSEFLGTKGRWEINPKAIRNVRCRDLTIASTSQGQSGDNEEEERANALLISKAPEMLEMLKYFTAFPDEDFEEEFTEYMPYGMTVDVRKVKEAKQLIKEATEL